MANLSTGPWVYDRVRLTVTKVDPDPVFDPRPAL